MSDKKAVMSINLLGVVLVTIVVLEIFKVTSKWLYVFLTVISAVLFVCFMVYAKFVKNFGTKEKLIHCVILSMLCLLALVAASRIAMSMGHTSVAISLLSFILMVFNIIALTKVNFNK